MLRRDAKPPRPTGASRGQTAFYAFSRLACRFVQVQCVRVDAIGLENLPKSGGYQLAVTHLGHLEPVVVGLLVRRYVRWMSRIEFYRHAVPRWLLNGVGAFRVHRQGVPVSAIRTAIDEVDRGGVVGLFPEGGRVVGEEAVIRGGRIKRGVCLIAQRTRRPVVPVVVLGAEKLNRAGTYLPFRRGHVWASFGEPVDPPPATGDRRADRQRLAAQLELAYRRQYAELLRHFGLSDAQFP